MVGPVRILVTGASELPQEHLDFARELGRLLMVKTGFVLVTGGLRSKGGTQQPALDGIVVDAAFDAIDKSVEAARSRIETIVPERDRSGLVRVSTGTLIQVSQSNPRMRRHSMVLRSDAVIAVNGGKTTREVIDLAYIAHKPLLPLPTTGGAARDAWEEYRGEILRRLNLNDVEASALENPATVSGAVSVCLDAIIRVLRSRCFVAMRFDNHPVPTAFDTIRSAAEEAGYRVIRVDQEVFAGNIVEEIWDSIRHSDVVIADLTGHSPNVYYELGISHALNKPTLLLLHSPEGNVPSNIPFDISVQRILPYAEEVSLRSQLERHLSDRLQPLKR